MYPLYYVRVESCVAPNGPENAGAPRSRKGSQSRMTLLELLKLLKKHLALLIALPVAFALVAGVYCYALLPDTYSASASVYVLVKGNSETVSSSSLYSDLSASQLITNDVAELITSDRVSTAAASELGLKSLAGYKVSVSSDTTSRVISLSVTGTDQAGVAKVANAIAKNVSDIAQSVMDVQSINTIDEAQTPLIASGPNRKLYVAVAFLAGAFVAVAVVVLMDMVNTKIRGQEDLEDLLDVPVIGRIPRM